jgi:membrane-bound lytic murein transglycosylase D
MLIRHLYEIIHTKNMNPLNLMLVIYFVLVALPSSAALSKNLIQQTKKSKSLQSESSTPEIKVDTLEIKLKKRLQNDTVVKNISPIFDIPVTYNKRVSRWITYFQNSGRTWFREWLQKAYRYMPMIQKELKNNNLPQDLAYMVMIESGFNPHAVSSAKAVGPWQFIKDTGKRYGLQVSWWLDERRDLRKSTSAAVKYLKDLNEEFNSWYLVAASYNMGEGGLRRRIKKYETTDFWKLCQLGALPAETTDYVPKILAAMMIAKSPEIYGFFDIAEYNALDYEVVYAPGGTDLNHLADHLGVTRKYMKDLNAEMVVGYLPQAIKQHPIRIPTGSRDMVMQFFEKSVSL